MLNSNHPTMLRFSLYLVFFFFIDFDLNQTHSLAKKEVMPLIKNYIATVLHEIHFDIQIDYWQDSWFQKETEKTISLDSLEFSQDSRHFTLHAKGKKDNTITIRGNLVKMIPVPVLKRPLNETHIIEEGDLVFKEFPTDRLQNNTLLTTQEIVGHTLKRGKLRVECALVREDLDLPILIEKGTPTTLFYNSPNLHIQNMGIAKSNGRLNEVIFFDVQSGSKLRSIRACIVDKSKARVFF